VLRLGRRDFRVSDQQILVARLDRGQ